MADKPMPNTEDGWRKQLTPEQYRVLREKGTEPPFTGEYLHAEGDGTFTCAACGNKLFSSDAKFDSGTGWPSFTQPAVAGNVAEREDRAFFMRRTEVRCATCDAHLGHVFPDGPQPTGQRYCMNGVAMTFTPEKE